MKRGFKQMELEWLSSDSIAPEDIEPDSPTSLADLRIGGTEVHYYVLCPRKHWWYAHGLEQEHAGGASTTAGQENVDLGTQLHEASYARKHNKEALIDDLLRIDFTEDGAVHEIKKSKGGSRAYAATRMQLLYYLMYLKREKGVEREGVIDYPKERRRETIVLTDADEARLDETLTAITAARIQSTPPFVPEPMGICKKCAYNDLCWG